MALPSTSPNALAGMQEGVARLSEELRELGLNLVMWDRQGEMLGEYTPCAYSQLLGYPANHRVKELQAFARDIIAQGQPAKGQACRGCCMVGVPLMHRRRVTGAATVCFPVAEMAEGSSLAELGDRANLDKEKAQGLIRTSCRYQLGDADEVLRLLSWLLNREQAIHVAHDELANLSANLATTYEELSLLYRISGCMKVTGSASEFLKNVSDDLLEVMNIEAAVGVIYAHPPAVRKDIVVLSGSIDLNMDQIEMLTSTQISPRLAHADGPILDNHYSASPETGLGVAVNKIVAVPLMTDDEVIGMLVGINKRGRDFDSSDVKLINSIANQASVFLVNNRLYADLQDLLMGVLHALTATIDAKDPYTCGHSHRVATLAKRIAEKAGFSAEKVQQIYMAGLLHDIGKIGVPERVLCKEGRLTDEEYTIVKRHPAIGARILQGIRQLDEIIVGIFTHHERPDGRGYPQGLSGDQVPIEGRIVGLADVFDAMTSDRTYRKALKLEDVLTEIKRCAGTQFDPKLVETFLSFDFNELMKELHQNSVWQSSVFGYGPGVEEKK